MDQAASANQALLRNLGERGEDVRYGLPSALYVLVAIARKRLNVDLSLHTMLQVLSVTPFEKIPLFQLFSDTAEDPNMPHDDNQLKLL